MSNQTLRKRFNIADTNYPMASRIISDAVEAGLIKLSTLRVRQGNTHITYLSGHDKFTYFLKSTY